MVELIQKQQSNDEAITSFIWKGVAPPRAQIFAWFVLKEKVLTKIELRMRGLLKIEDDLNCVLCELEDEDVDHLFLNCLVARGL